MELELLRIIIEAPEGKTYHEKQKTAWLNLK
jgi:hypothetical protein